MFFFGIMKGALLHTARQNWSTTIHRVPSSHYFSHVLNADCDRDWVSQPLTPLNPLNPFQPNRYGCNPGGGCLPMLILMLNVLTHDRFSHCLLPNLRLNFDSGTMHTISFLISHFFFFRQIEIYVCALVCQIAIRCRVCEILFYFVYFLHAVRSDKETQRTSQG